MIVMLTRLNENSVQMCHCYWPTNQAAVNVASAGQSTSSSPTQPGNRTNNNSASTSTSTSNVGQTESAVEFGCSATTTSSLLQAGAETTALTTLANIGSVANNGARRSSVTSVFNSSEAARGSSSNGGNNLPIIANGELSNNILCFDIINSSLDSSSLDEETNNGNSNSNVNVKPSKSKLKLGANNAASATTSQQTGNFPQGQANQSKTTRFEVHLVSEHVSSSDYLVRNMYMINRSTGETRTITQFHYLAWPECGVPDNVKSFLQFRRKVHKSYRNLKRPILVHCSDGAGRSGTYTLIDIILERIKNGAKEIDLRATLEHLRDQRVALCATQKQFEFVLVALAEEIQIILNALPH